jgi:glycine cleavage system regulatory protein
VQTLVLTVIGDDRAGLVEALSEVVAEHGGNWERSRLAELAGTFAGIVLVTVPPERRAGLVAALEPLGEQGLLDVEVTLGHQHGVGAPGLTLHLHLLGNDQPGIVREVSTALAASGINIAELRTETREAPMAGGLLFEAEADLEAPADLDVEVLRSALERLGEELMVQIDLD